MTNTKIELPKFGLIFKDGKSVWGRVPYEFTFETKEEYLSWRKSWKVTYAELSLQIRQDKHLRNNGFRNNDGSGYRYQDAACKGKEAARTMMEILTEAKKLSQQLYLESRKIVT